VIIPNILKTGNIAIPAAGKSRDEREIKIETYNTEQNPRLFSMLYRMEQAA
jgi:hypothetical protein